MSDGKGSFGDVLSKYLQSRYKVLFYTLLLTLISAPILGALEWPGTLLDLFLGASLLAAIMPVTSTKDRRYVLVAMIVVWVARPVAEWMEHPLVSRITLGVWTLIGLMAAAAALRFAMRATSVDAEHLYAALSAYLLAGIYFGLLYWLLEQMNHGMFTLNGIFSQASAIYFSFVTLATLGYGDIAPRGDIARGIAIVEGVGGQLFLAVLVARLVSLYSKPADR
jgi:voltage-gated potassium channel